MASSSSSSSKGPLDQFYRDCLRIGSIKVGGFAGV